MRWIPPALVVVALMPASAAAQAPKGAAARIDFRALTDGGQPVGDLKAEEISLKVNGKARTLQSLTFVQAAAAGGPASGGSRLPAPFATNVVATAGRTIHLLIDDDSISPGREGQLKEAVRLLVSELGPGDRIGVMTAQGQVNMRPGADPTKVRLAVDELAGRASSVESEADAQCRTTRVLAAVGSMLAITGGTPTTIVIFSGGISPPQVKQIRMGSQTSAGTNDVCPVTPEDFRNIGTLASTARADLYLFHLTEAMVNRSTALDAGFESLAGVTGAEFVRVPASTQAAVSRLLRETAAYYVATFEPEPGERNGQALRVEVKAAREDVKLRARPAVVIPKDVGKAASPKDMLRTATEYRDLPLRAAAYPSRTAGSDEVTIVALFETMDPAATIASASVGLFDEKNTLKKQWTAESADLGKRPVMAALAAPAGTYRLRVAAVDRSGRAGTADYELKAEVPRADPLKLSSLLLGTQQQGGGFAPRLQFTDESIAIGYLEIYGVPKGGKVTVELDVAETAEGAPLATAQTSVNPGKTDDMRIAYGGFSIASLSPGDYQMRAVVSLDGKPVGKVVRTLRKTQ
jgi:hypothetical protein